MIRQTPRLVNLASRSAVARNAAGAPSKQQLALRSFASSEDAKRTVSSPEAIDPLEVFAAIDTNNDGVLQKDEFLRAVDMLNYDEVRVHFSMHHIYMYAIIPLGYRHWYIAIDQLNLFQMFCLCSLVSFLHLSLDNSLCSYMHSAAPQDQEEYRP